MSITQGLARQYAHYLDRQLPVQIMRAQFERSTLKLNTIGIVGGGMAGLYSALLLKHLRPDVSVKILEATDRVGGRVYTHRFSDEKYQYFEAGAMRLPEVSWQTPVFDLIKFLNSKLREYHIDLIPYQYSCPTGNRVYVNGTKQKDGKIMSVDYADKNLKELGFPPGADATENAGKLLQDAINPVVKELNINFPAALKKYDSMTLHFYLSQVLRWSEAKINYVEVMSSQTNEFQNGLIDQAILNSDFTGQVVTAWKTIDNGMCRLPEACANLFGKENIMLEAPVESLKYVENDRVQVGYVQSESGKMNFETFDSVILALPPSATRMIPIKPQWPVPLEHGLRSIHFQPLYKIGLRFKSRFWEREDLRPSRGGQSITDLPSRWVVYPSYGIGDKGKGVLIWYSWMTDSIHWLPKSKVEKIKMALYNLQQIYPEVDISKEYAGSESKEAFLKEGFPFQWAVRRPLGNATFYAGQFSSLYPIMKLPQGNIYFAGEHLSVYHTWIVGALDSAKFTVGKLLQNFDVGTKKVEYLS